MRPLLPAVLLLPVLDALVPACVFAQDVKKEVLDHIRKVSVSIEANGRCIGSGTLFRKHDEKDDEFYVITARHVVQASRETPLRVAQRLHNKKPISVFAEVVSQCERSDVAILKVGQGVFFEGAKFHSGCPCDVGLDTPIVHCGSMAGMHHTVTRGYIVGLDRDMVDRCGIGPKKADQADITATYGSSGGGVFLTDGRYIGMCA